MSKKSSSRLVYALSSTSSDTGGHSLGVNSLAVDPTATDSRSGLLYSAGRDGIINAWAFDNVDVSSPWDTDQLDESRSAAPPTIEPKKGQKDPYGTTRSFNRTQIHTNWVNDILLTNDKQAVISCSSDLTVKLWNPTTNDTASVGQHLDYVKCLASSSQDDSWVVSGGLDRKIFGWDLVKGGEKLSIDVGDKGSNPKGSVYALAVNNSQAPLIAAGGPESVVRIWDARTVDPVFKFVGHTDNIRDILISDDGNWVLSASSDSTIKLWSTTAGRVFQTLDMHEDSVWSLYSAHPNLSVFYSSDRSGMVIKTDLRGCASIEDAVCSVVCDEHEGISKVIAAGSNVWAATCNSRIHRWKNVDTGVYAARGLHHVSNGHVNGNGHKADDSDDHSKESDAKQDGDETSEKTSDEEKTKSDNTIKTHFREITGGPSIMYLDKPIPETAEKVVVTVEPVSENPVETLQGHIGLIKHRLLSDRRRVLTLDTAGDIKMWDLVRGVVLQSFDRGMGLDLDTIADQLNPLSFVSNWCQVSIRTGELYVSLEKQSCFDAEVYSDDLATDPENASVMDSEIPEDHRINYGRWVIRNLLGNLLTEVLERNKLEAPEEESGDGESALKYHDRAPKKEVDYDSVQKVEDPPDGAKEAAALAAAQAAEAKNASGGGKFMGRFRGFGKGKKDKDDKANGAATPAPAPVVPTTPAEKEYANLGEFVRVLKAKAAKTGNVEPIFHPPTTLDAPIVEFPAHTKVMISEQLPGSGDTMDVYRATVGSVANDYDLLEKVVPGWIAKVLLENEIPIKEPPKVGFVIHQYDEAQGLSTFNVRLTVYHMIRARKIMQYVEERLKADGVVEESVYEGKKPEEWLEIYCQGHKVPPKMSMATIRTRIWRSGGDVVLKYRLAPAPAA